MSVNLPSTVGRQYVFRLHGQRWWKRVLRTRAATAARAAGHQCGVFTVESIADHEYLLRLHDLLRRTRGPAPGIDGLSYDDFSRAEVAAVLRHASRAILRREYRPQSTRQVLVAKGDGRYRELRLGTIVDRVIATALYQAIGPVIEALLLPMCCGFRTGRGSWQMLAAIDRASPGSISGLCTAPLAACSRAAG